MDIYHASLLVISAVLLATCIAQAIIIRRPEKIADFFDPVEYPKINYESRAAREHIRKSFDVAARKYTP